MSINLPDMSGIDDIAARLAEHLSDESLTEREIHVLRHLAGGNRNRDIGAHDRAQALAIAARRGIIEL